MDAEKTKPNRRARRLMILGAVGAVLVGTVVGVRWFCHGGMADMGSGPAGPAVVRHPFEKVWTERPVLFLGLGDSITAGYGATPGFAYFDRLVTNPPGDFEEMQGICLSSVLPNLTARNWAVSGTNSLEHQSQQIARLKPADAETFGLVVFSTGGNDLILQYGRTPPREGAMYGISWEEAQPWVAAYEKRLNEMLDAVAAAFPGGCHIFLLNIYDPTDGTGSVFATGLPRWPDGLRLVHAYNDIISRAAAARAHVHLIDIHTPFLGHGLHCKRFWLPTYRRTDPHYWYSIIEDPNDRGYDCIRRMVLNEMASVMAAPSRNADDRF